MVHSTKRIKIWQFVINEKVIFLLIISFILKFVNDMTKKIDHLKKLSRRASAGRTRRAVTLPGKRKKTNLLMTPFFLQTKPYFLCFISLLFIYLLFALVASLHVEEITIGCVVSYQ